MYTNELKNPLKVLFFSVYNLGVATLLRTGVACVCTFCVNGKWKNHK